MDGRRVHTLGCHDAGEVATHLADLLRLPVVTAPAARAAGVDHVAVRRARRHGDLVQMSRGLDLTPVGDTELGRLQAALAVSPDSVLSGPSVVRLMGISVPGSGRTRSPCRPTHDGSGRGRVCASWSDRSNL